VAHLHSEGIVVLSQNADLAAGADEEVESDFILLADANPLSPLDLLAPITFGSDVMLFVSAP
jgi:hypothetical protein